MVLFSKHNVFFWTLYYFITISSYALNTTEMCQFCVYSLTSRNEKLALAGVAQVVRASSHNCKVVGSIP